MKKLLLSALFTTSILVAFEKANAQAYLVHYWNFNAYTTTYNLPAIPGLKANLSRLDTNKAQVLWAKSSASTLDSSYIDPYTPVAADYDTVNARLGDAAGSALRLRNPATGMELRMYVPTNHYKNIKLIYGSMRSNNGMLQQVFDYSVDSGTTWRTTGLNITSDSPLVVFKRTTITFGSDTQVNNNGKLVFRIKFNGNTVTTSGNNRFDNITLEGDSVIAPIVAVSQVQPLEANIYPNPFKNILQITTADDAMKTALIYDLQGRLVLKTTLSGRYNTLDVADLNKGFYTIVLKGTMNNTQSTSVIVKE